jgi:hypothetical protein
MKVFLHIGAPKTGSSAIQLFLNNNRARLLKSGFYYPKHNLDPNKVSGGHGELARYLETNQVAEAEALRDKWFAEAKESNCALLLSAEGFFRQSKKLNEFFLGCDVTVIAYLRDPIEYLISIHNQSVKRHFSTKNLQEFLQRILVSNDRSANGTIFKEWIYFFGKNRIKVVPYHVPYFPKGQIERSFLDSLSIKNGFLCGFRFNTKLVNTKYTEEALELKRLLNHVIKSDMNGESNKIDRFLQNYSDRVNNKNTTSNVSIDADLLNALYKKFEGSYNYFVDELLEYVPPGFLGNKIDIKAGCTPDLKKMLMLYSEMSVSLPSISNLIRGKVKSALNEDAVPYAVLKLADIIGLPYSEPSCVSHIDEMALKSLNNNKSRAPDYLREWARHLSEMKLYGEALNVIKEAEVLRPNGAVIVRLREEIEKKIDFNKK